MVVMAPHLEINPTQPVIAETMIEASLGRPAEGDFQR
jgi:hypothetical protein